MLASNFPLLNIFAPTVGILYLMFALSSLANYFQPIVFANITHYLFYYSLISLVKYPDD